MIIRFKEITNIIRELKNNNTILLKGKSGSGKTVLLKQLEKILARGILIESNPASSITNKLCSYQHIKNERTIKESAEKIKLPHKTILLVDSCEDMTKNTARIIKNFERQGALIVGAGTKCNKYTFNKTINIDKLEENDAEQVITYYLPDASYYEIKLIKWKTGRKAEKIKEVCNKLKDRKDRIKVILEYDNKLPQINMGKITGIGFLLLALRYIFYHQKDFQTGYALAMIAYLLLFAKRWKGY